MIGALGTASALQATNYAGAPPDTGIYVNEQYEVVEVFEHIPRMKQQREF